jgi:hypothetical protein
VDVDSVVPRQTWIRFCGVNSFQSAFDVRASAYYPIQLCPQLSASVALLLCLRDCFVPNLQLCEFNTALLHLFHALYAQFS